MSAAVANYYSRIDPHYRRFELPWTRMEEEAKRLKTILISVMGVLLVLAVIIPFLPVAEIERNTAADIPPRLAKLVIEKKSLPPPPPPIVKPPVKEPALKKPAPKALPKPKPIPVVIPAKPVEVRKVAKVVEPPPIKIEPSRKQIVEQARKKAKTVGLLAVADDLASLRQNSALANTNNRSLSSAVQTSQRTERALITSKSSTRSAGVNTAVLTRSTGGGGLAGRSTTAVSAPVSIAATSIAQGSGASTISSTGTGGAGQRSQDQIERVFDQNKAAIYALYRRALRADPTLQGKLVLQLTIAATGKVTSCSVVSSELDSNEFENNLIRRVKMFDFGAQDVDEITTTKPIDFFPA